MARTKEYERNDVLNRAVSLFWAKGFEATSMSDLVKATGLNTFSMYREFGSKEGLFEAAMESYYRSWLRAMVHPLVEKPGLPAIREFFGKFPDMVASRDFLGCLFMNTLTEKNVVNKKAIDRVAEFCDELAGLLERAIRAGQRAGDIPHDKDAKVLAQYFLCIVEGLVLYGRVSNDKKMIRDMLATAVAAVEG